jgi:actin beta/gamma 1
VEVGLILTPFTKIHFLLFLGTTLIGEFAEKFQQELLPYRQDINIISVPNRKYLSFMGASQYSVSDTMEHLWLKKQDFDECGPRIVREKFF